MLLEGYLLGYLSGWYMCTNSNRFGSRRLAEGLDWLEKGTYQLWHLLEVGLPARYSLWAEALF